MKLGLAFLLLLFSGITQARDLSSDFFIYYNQDKTLSDNDLATLKDLRIILIPGILGEVLSWGDEKEAKFFISDYFKDQLNAFKKLKLSVTRLSTSSKSVAETRHNIQLAMQQAISENKKTLFFNLHFMVLRWPRFI